LRLLELHIARLTLFWSRTWDKGGQRWYEGNKGGGGEPETGPRVTDQEGNPIDTTYDPYENVKPGTGARNLQDEGRGIQRSDFSQRYPQDGNWKMKARWWSAKTIDVVRRLGGAFGEFFKHGPDVIIVLTPPEIIKDYIRGRAPREIKSDNIRRGTSPDQDRGDVVSTEKASDDERR